MIRNYKLAANFNTVEFEITDEDILQEIPPEDLEYDQAAEVFFTDEAKENAIKRILQREYDILASVKVINVAPPIKQVEPIDPPSEKMIRWAENLGMKDAAKRSKQEVFEFIQKNKK